MPVNRTTFGSSPLATRPAASARGRPPIANRPALWRARLALAASVLVALPLAYHLYVASPRHTVAPPPAGAAAASLEQSARAEGGTPEAWRRHGLVGRLTAWLKRER